VYDVEVIERDLEQGVVRDRALAECLEHRLKVLETLGEPAVLHERQAAFVLASRELLDVALRAEDDAACHHRDTDAPNT
jgi:hypothetical protein